MEVYFNICSEYRDKDIRNSVELINESIEHHGLFQREVSGGADSHLKEINVLLQSVKTRAQGFQLLLPIIQQGSPALIGERGEQWFGVCCQAVSSLCGAKEKISACKIMSVILRASANLHELHRYFNNKSHAPLIQNLATADSSWNSAALECLYDLIKLASGQCLPQKVIIEGNMLKYLDCPLTRVGQEDIVKRAGRVFAVLPLPGMGGNKALGRAEARGRQLTELVALAHKTMDSLFEGVVEKESYKHTRECTLKVTPIKFEGENSSDAVRGFLTSVTRLGNILKFISQMLASDCVESLSVVPYRILGPLFRLLQVDSTVLKSYHSQEHQLLAFLIVSLHHHALLLLRDFITSLGECIDLYFGVICELLTSVIKRSFIEDDADWCSSGIQTRVISYSILNTVLQVSRGRHMLPKEIVTLILKDIVPKSQRVTLQSTQSKGLQSLTVQKKKKKKGYAIKESSELSHSGPLFQSQTLCRVTKVALMLAETLVVCASHSLPHKIRQVLQTNVFQIAEAVTNGAHLPEAYTCPKTRAQLYRTLASLATYPDPRSPPPYTMILYLLQHGQQDQEMLVVTTCQTLIGNVSFILANPQISEMASALQYSRLASDQDLEDEASEVVPAALMRHQAQKGRESPEIGNNGNNGKEEEELADWMEELPEDEFGEGFDVGEEAEFAEEVEDEEEDNEEEEEEIEDEDDDEGDADEASLEDGVMRNGINGVSEAESLDEEELELAEDAGETIDENGHEQISNDVTESSTTSDADTTLIKTLKAEVSQSTAKRKSTDDLHPNSKVTKRKDSNECNEGGLSIEEMLSSFVDADPDEQ